ncbi:hypothetical protein LR48_Vigan09g086600 [Vigna angularis]|uniref:Putative plant transposon protein domain-containing protein n=1 Tax=Phaseolus angularis TaxID=3914 RepID=A0A0L9VBB1_PHAAN|nr:hypothetical protein LR48_Vigan09g086600 [Vigna angularis]
MASLSGKRIKTIGSKRKDKEPKRSYSCKFLSYKHERHFSIVQDRRLLMERKAGLILNFAPQFGEQLENRNWERLSIYPAPANIVVVKEFYTNARRLGDYSTEEYRSYVRGHTIQALLLYYVLRGMSINIGQVIANEIQVCANTMNNKAPLGHPSLITHFWAIIAEEIKSCAHAVSNRTHLGHPSLITHLCEMMVVDVLVPPFEQPRKELNEAYFTYYCSTDGLATTRPPQQVPMMHRRAPPPAYGLSHEAAPFQMRDMYMSLMEARMMALYRGEQELLRMLTSAFPDRGFISQEEFAAKVAYLEDPAHAVGGDAADEEEDSDD